jgi:hypothetical protein
MIMPTASRPHFALVIAFVGVLLPAEAFACLWRSVPVVPEAIVGVSAFVGLASAFGCETTNQWAAGFDVPWAWAFAAIPFSYLVVRKMKHGRAAKALFVLMFVLTTAASVRAHESKSVSGFQPADSAALRQVEF